METTSIFLTAGILTFALGFVLGVATGKTLYRIQTAIAKTKEALL